MELRKLFYLLLILPILFIGTSCSSDDDTTNPPVTVNEAEALVKYLEANGDFINTSAPAMIKASDVNTNILAGADQVVIDIRSADDYAAGHIQGAVNVALGDLVSYYESNSLQNKEVVVIACYTGQTAGYATSVLRLLGYNNVKDLKWGMCSWNEATSAKWVNNIGNSHASQLVTTDYPKNSAGDLPTLSTGKTEGADILKDRITTLMANDPFGSVKISADAVFSNLSNYYIVNYWKAADYSWGHIDGAVQYTPKADLKLDTFLKTLPTDKTIVVYCYTGQTSAHVAAFLKILGYDAKTLLFGVNGMAYDTMPGTKFVPETDIHDYDLVQ